METIDIGNRTGGILRINRKSDFPLVIRLAGGEFPDYDFTLRATSGSGFTVFKAERRNGICLIVRCLMVSLWCSLTIITWVRVV